MAAINFITGITAIWEMCEAATNFSKNNGLLLTVFGVLISAIYICTDNNNPVPFLCSIVLFFFVCCLYNYLNSDTKTGLSKSKPIEESKNLMALCRQHAEADDEELLQILKKKFEENKIDVTALLNMHIDTLLKKKLKLDNEKHTKRFITIRALIRKEEIEQRHEHTKIALNPLEVKSLNWEQVLQLLHAEIKAYNEEQFETWCTFLERGMITGDVLVNIQQEKKEEYKEELALVEGQRSKFETIMKKINKKPQASKSTTINKSNLGVASFGDSSNVKTGKVIYNTYDSKKEDKNSNNNSNEDTSSDADFDSDKE